MPQSFRRKGRLKTSQSGYNGSLEKRQQQRGLDMCQQRKRLTCLINGKSFPGELLLESCGK